MGLTEGERGFEQTKECYLTEIGSMMRLSRKNLLIANDNLIVDCLSKEVFYIATNSELTVSRFNEMHEAHTIIQTRCLELKAELSKLRVKVQKDDHTESVKCFSNLEITRAKHIEQTTALLTENENLKAQIYENLKCNTMESIKPRVLAPGRYAIEVERIPYHNKNNREVHLHYLKHLKESVETLREIVEEAKVEQLNTQKTNVPVPPSTRVNCCTNASGSQPRSNTKKNRISPAKGVNKKKVKEHPRINKSNLRTTNQVDSSRSSKRTIVNSNSNSVCQTCNKCLISVNHDVCVVDYLQSVKASPSIHNIHNVVRKVRQVWKPTCKVLTSVGHQWRPTGRILTLEEQCPLTRLTKTKVAPAKQNEN
ncbi:hypothetical protein Tco_0470872 [Tanacetum coccineum]